LELSPSILDMDLYDTALRIKRFIKDYVRKVHARGVVLGLSGGVDSCTTAALSALALGGDRVLALMLPEEETRSEEDIKHANLICNKFGIKTQLCDITQVVREFYRVIPKFDFADRISRGNIKARARMICIYYYANNGSRIVCGSSDKSETMMGYFTKWGDIAADISPIMDLFKTQVRRLAKHIGIRSEISNKPASPGLWPGQTAESELGISYEKLDLILYGFEHFMRSEEIARKLELKVHVVKKLEEKWLAAEHKRRVLLTTKLEYRTIGADFRVRRG
jgi:NAD+ synthase